MAWIESPMKTNVDILLKWCCENSEDVAWDFVEQFGSIFTPPIEDLEVRTVLLSIFMQTVLNQAGVTRIETFVATVKEGSPDPGIIAILFAAMPKLEDNNLKPLTL
jgi:hypothetical protein